MTRRLSTFTAVAGFLLSGTTQPSAQDKRVDVAPGSYVAIDGGLACSKNKSLTVAPDPKLGDDGCGGTGGVEFGRTGVPVFSIFDHWAVRGRLTGFKDDASAVFGGAIVDSKFTDRRIVLDAEVGVKTPFSMFGGTTRATLGLRYAQWTGDLEAHERANPANNATSEFTTSGFGPRIGAMSIIPLGTHWSYESRFGIAALFGQQKAENRIAGALDSSASSNAPVFSVDSLSLLSYRPNGDGTGLAISAGLFSEYWIRQIDINADGENARRSRNSWGPVARIRIPLQ